MATHLLQLLKSNDMYFRGAQWQTIQGEHEPLKVNSGLFVLMFSNTVHSAVRVIKLLYQAQFCTSAAVHHYIATQAEES